MRYATGTAFGASANYPLQRSDEHRHRTITHGRRERHERHEEHGGRKGKERAEPRQQRRGGEEKKEDKRESAKKDNKRGWIGRDDRDRRHGNGKDKGHRNSDGARPSRDSKRARK